MLSKNEARRIAVNIAKMPELVPKAIADERWPSRVRRLAVSGRARSEARGRRGLGQVGNAAQAVALFVWTATAPQPLTLNVAV